MFDEAKHEKQRKHLLEFKKQQYIWIQSVGEDRWTSVEHDT